MPKTGASGEDIPVNKVSQSMSVEGQIPDPLLVSRVDPVKRAIFYMKLRMWVTSANLIIQFDEKPLL